MHGTEAGTFCSRRVEFRESPRVYQTFERSDLRCGELIRRAKMKKGAAPKFIP